MEQRPQFMEIIVHRGTREDEAIVRVQFTSTFSELIGFVTYNVSFNGTLNKKEIKALY
jgi:hypothetical protein